MCEFPRRAGMRAFDWAHTPLGAPPTWPLSLRTVVRVMLTSRYAMGIFDWKHWIVILVVVVLVFGTKKLKNLGTDVGESIKGFRKAMQG